MLDDGLAVLLLFVLPGYMAWRSLRTGDTPEPRSRTYGRAVALAAGLDGLAALDWARAGRSLAALGLAAPTSPAALGGLGVAAAILVVVGVALAMRPPRKAAVDDPNQRIMPRTRLEAVAFVAFLLIVGCSWEVLYRAYLLWFLPRFLPTILCVVLAAGAYGVAHGFKSAKLLAASLLSALLFTSAYAVTRSLWWLMVLHCGLPLIAGLAFYRQQRHARAGAAGVQPSALHP